MQCNKLIIYHIHNVMKCDIEIKKHIMANLLGQYQWWIDSFQQKATT